MKQTTSSFPLETELRHSFLSMCQSVKGGTYLQRVVPGGVADGVVDDASQARLEQLDADVALGVQHGAVD